MRLSPKNKVSTDNADTLSAVVKLAEEMDDFLQHGVESHALLSLSVDVLDSLEQDIDRLRLHGVSCGQALGRD